MLRMVPIRLMLAVTPRHLLVLLLLGPSLRHNLAQIVMVKLSVGLGRAKLLRVHHDRLLCCTAHRFKLQIGPARLYRGVRFSHLLLLAYLVLRWLPVLLLMERACGA